jgi:hypothetical protein
VEGATTGHHSRRYTPRVLRVAHVGVFTSLEQGDVFVYQGRPYIFQRHGPVQHDLYYPDIDVQCDVVPLGQTAVHVLAFDRYAFRSGDKFNKAWYAVPASAIRIQNAALLDCPSSGVGMVLLDQHSEVVEALLPEGSGAEALLETDQVMRFPLVYMRF